MKFLHLSDLHFTTDTAGTVFDHDLKIREALLDDLGKDGRDNYQGIFVTGDIAYHGHADEFARASTWLEDVRKKTASTPEAIFVVPGNHDVNRAIVGEGSSLWSLHQMLRQDMPPAARSDSLDKKLQDSLDFLSAQKEYAAFAKEHECPSTAANPAWSFTLDETFDDGSRVRIHGLNSAILCDGMDAKGNLLLGDCQFHHFDNRPGFVNIVLCHHPASWLIDGPQANDHLRNQAHLVLSGHEHDARCYLEGKSLRVMAGAVHPNRRDQKWEPTYHAIWLSVRQTDSSRDLVIRVESRVWLQKDLRFGPVAEASGALHVEHVIPLAAWTRPSPNPPQASTVLPLSPVPVTSPSPSSISAEAYTSARRRLIVHFFRLGMVSRYETVITAGVWQDSDDAFDGQAKWARVFDRAEKEQKFPALWEAVAKKDETLAAQPNPFIPST